MKAAAAAAAPRTHTLTWLRSLCLALGGSREVFLFCAPRAPLVRRKKLLIENTLT
jgi:hypothetical protein